MTRHFTPHHLIGRGGGHCLRSIHFALVLPLRSSHMPLMPRTVGWLTRPNPTNVYQRTSSCRHWETSHWGRRRLPKANLFCFVVGVSRGFCVGFRDGSSGERISTRRMEWSFLAKVLRGRPLRFRSHKIHQSSVWQSHCAQVLKHLTFQNIFFFSVAFAMQNNNLHTSNSRSCSNSKNIPQNCAVWFGTLKSKSKLAISDNFLTYFIVELRHGWYKYLLSLVQKLKMWINVVRSFANGCTLLGSQNAAEYLFMVVFIILESFSSTAIGQLKSSTQ